MGNRRVEVLELMGWAANETTINLNLDRNYPHLQ